MESVIVESEAGITLAGGGRFGAGLLSRARELAPRLVAADGGADRLLALGVEPEAVIGDLDSISARARERLGARVVGVAEQESTDFDKALRAIRAPFVLGLGFAGERLDHELAVLSGLVAHAARRVLILSGRDVTFVAPRELRLRLPLGSRLSLFPMGEVRGESRGLEWPIDGITFAPDGRIGTSNRVVAEEVELRFDAAKMLVILPRAAVPAALAGLGVMPDARGG